MLNQFNNIDGFKNTKQISSKLQYDVVGLNFNH